MTEPNATPMQRIERTIFENHFGSILDEAHFERVMRIFDEVALHNERSIALQLHTAATIDKLDEVLAEYDELISDIARHEVDGPLDPVIKAVAIRRFADHIYLNVLAEGNSMRLFRLTDEVNTPPIFTHFDRPIA